MREGWGRSCCNQGRRVQVPSIQTGREGEREREREKKKKKILTLQQKLGTDPEVMRLVNWQMDSSRLEQQPPATHTPFSFPFPFSFSAAASRREAAGASAPLASSCSPGRGDRRAAFLPPAPLLLFLPQPAMVACCGNPSYCSPLASKQRSRRSRGVQRGWREARFAIRLGFGGIAAAVTPAGPLLEGGDTEVGTRERKEREGQWEGEGGERAVP